MTQATAVGRSGLRGLAIAGLAALTFALAPAAALGQAADADPLPVPGTLLEPGRYATSAVGPSLEFRVSDGWIVGATPPGPIFTLERTDQPGTVLTVTRFDGDAFTDSCDSTSVTTVETTVQRLTEIIGGNPYLNPGPPAITQVDGNPGLLLDVAVPAYTECPLAWLLLWALPIGEGGEFVQVANQQSRFVILDVAGDVIVVAIESFPGVPFAGLLEASMELVDTMRIEPGAYIPPEPTATSDAGPSLEPSPATSPTPMPSLAAADEADAST